MALWTIYLMGTVTLLTIALRRLRSRQKPLDDELYSKRVAIDHVHSGVAWVRIDGRFGSVNQSFAATLGGQPAELAGHDWVETMFPKPDWGRIRQAYSQMLIMGKESFETNIERADGSLAWVDVLLVAVHDHKMRFVGHHCLVDDRTRERLLTQELADLARQLHPEGSSESIYRSALTLPRTQKK